jgi:hypothetical protein
MRNTAIKRAGPFRAVSRDDGRILVSPTWPAGRGNGGVFARLELADEIEQVLNALHKKLAPKDRKPAIPREDRAIGISTD